MAAASGSRGYLELVKHQLALELKTSSAPKDTHPTVWTETI